MGVMLRNYVTRGLWMILIPLINLFYGPLDQAKGKVYSLVSQMLSVLVILSTVFLKQHTILDVTG